MTPNDLYGECVPIHLGRTPQQNMFFPLRNHKPDRFLAVPTRSQWMRGNRGIVSHLRVVGMLKRLGL